MNKHIIIFIIVTLSTACARIGPDVIQAGGNDYNVAIQRTNDEQLLLNLVRLKYRDTPFFLEVNSVSSQFKLITEAELSANFKEQQTPENVGLSGRLTFTEQPTVTYLPLHGNDFIQRLLAPVSIDTILLLANTGWSIERILRLTVQSINGIPNAPTASGPTPKSAPVYKEFLSIASLFRDLQSANIMQFAYNQNGNDNHATVVLDENGEQQTAIQSLREKLSLDKQAKYTLLPGKGSTKDNQSITLSTRSLLGVMYYLSHSIEVPNKDSASGKVTITHDDSGMEFDWSDLTQGLFKIKSKPQADNDSGIGTNYRGSWFYIDDSDLDSKTTFSLLTQLFSLQSGKAEGITPVLTLPIGQ
jgi:hypothetical protein